MILKKLEIELSTYGEFKGQYRGEARFENENGKVTVVLKEQHCDAIFNLCADAIVQSSKEVANAMIKPILTQKALENNEVMP